MQEHSQRPGRPALLAVLCLAALDAAAGVALPAVFSDHMVLQQAMPVPVWGTAAPGEPVTVAFRDQTKSATADARGTWMVRLEPLQAGGPDIMTVTGSNRVTITDVLVGEVWLGAGQSNMALGVHFYIAKSDAALARAAAAGTTTVARVRRDDEHRLAANTGAKTGDALLASLASSNYPHLRLLRQAKWEPQRWQEATPQNNLTFSALLFAFGVALHRELGVPVGLMVGAEGATPACAWVSRTAVTNEPLCREAIAQFAASPGMARARQRWKARMGQWETEAAAARRQGAREPPKPNPLPIPGEPQYGYGGNYERFIRPFIPFAIRGVLWDQGESGTQVFGLDPCALMTALIRGWRKDWSQDFPFIYIQKPSGGGCAWDPQDPVTCRAEPFAPLPASPVVRNWHAGSNEKFARIHGLLPEAPDTSDPGQLHDYSEAAHLDLTGWLRWGDLVDGAAYLENYSRTCQVCPSTYMVVSGDLGKGLHPGNKYGYGVRACRVALATAYGRKVEYYGPVYASHATEGSEVRVRFAHAGSGLAFRHGDRLQGFAMAGEDRIFHWAEAFIDGDTVVVSCPDVPAPAAVRYAWNERRAWANLFNRDGLPALPFRTDAWPL